MSRLNNASVAQVTSAAPCGSVAFFPFAAAPVGWLKANGAAISRTTYAALFAAYGTTFGAGDGSTTFNLPDLRGEFLRGLDDGRGIDAGRILGSAQSGDIQSHTHFNILAPQPTGTGDSVPQSSGAAQTQRTSTMAATGGAETRPRNIALLACVKY